MIEWSGYFFCSENCREAVIEALCGENAPESDFRLESYARESNAVNKCANYYGCQKSLKTIFALGIQLDSRINLTEDNQLDVPPEFTLPGRKVAMNLDVIETPFVAMTSTDWNKFQDLMDRLGIREEVRALNLSVITIPKANVLRVKT